MSSSTWYTREEEINKEMEVEAAGQGGIETGRNIERTQP